LLAKEGQKMSAVHGAVVSMIMYNNLAKRRLSQKLSQIPQADDYIVLDEATEKRLRSLLNRQYAVIGIAVIIFVLCIYFSS